MAYNASSGQINAAVEFPVGSYVFLGIQTLYYPANNISGVDHPFIRATGGDLSLAANSMYEVSSAYTLESLVANRSGGVAVVGQQQLTTTTFAAFLLQLDNSGSFVQARSYANVAGPDLGAIATTATPGFLLGGVYPNPWVASTFSDGTVAGHCASGFASSTTITLSPSVLQPNASPIALSPLPLDPMDTSLTVSADQGTLSAQCHL